MKRRGLVLGLMVFVGVVGSALGVVYMRFANLPHPNDASHNQLMYWVVLRDLNDYEHDIQLALVNRFADEARDIFGKNNASEAQLSDAQSKRLLANIEILKKVWFDNRVAQYCDINRPETCEKFMDDQIALLNDFGNIAFEHADVLYPEKAGQNLTTISDELFADIDNWMEQTPEDKKSATLQAIREATVFWLSTEDLEVQVMEARKELVVRVIEQLAKGMNLESTTSVVTNERAKQLKHNAMLLMEAWVHILAEQYEELPKEKRKDFIDSTIADVDRWKLLEYLNSDSTSTSASSSQNSIQAVTEFNRTIKEWTKRANEQMQSKIKSLHTAFQQRIFMKMLQGNR